MKASSREQPRRFGLAFAVLVVSLLALYFGRGRDYVSLAYDPHAASCLPELHLVFLVHARPNVVDRGDYIFWKPSGALAYVKDDFALKKVAGVPGDKLVIKDNAVTINGAVVVTGFENASLYLFKKDGRDFEKNEVIPQDSYFVIGTAKGSNDSRYWGYLPKNEVRGKGYRIY